MRFLLFIVMPILPYLFSNTKEFDPYYEGLRLHVESFEGFTSPGIDTFFVQKQDFHSDYDQSIGKAVVRTIDDRELRGVIKRRGYMLLVVISPIKIENGELTMYVTNYVVKKKRNKYAWAGSDATKCRIGYDCQADSYKLTKCY